MVGKQSVTVNFEEILFFWIFSWSGITAEPSADLDLSSIGIIPNWSNQADHPLIRDNHPGLSRIILDYPQIGLNWPKTLKICEIFEFLKFFWNFLKFFEIFFEIFWNFWIFLNFWNFWKKLQTALPSKPIKLL